eukprot:147306-Amphidinium_carterae.2
MLGVAAPAWHHIDHSEDPKVEAQTEVHSLDVLKRKVSDVHCVRRALMLHMALPFGAQCRRGLQGRCGKLRTPKGGI